MSKMFGGAPSNASQTASQTASASAFTHQAFPDLFAPVRDAVKNTKRWVRQTFQKDLSTGSRNSRNADIIHMSDLIALVNKGELSKWQSNKSGVIEFDQAPEFTPEWDAWIARFRRALKIVMLRHLVEDSRGETRGTASAVFSVDKDGHLHGCLYQTTCDNNVNSALLASIRDLDGSKVLQFPSNSSITGWNFRMQWDFGGLLAMINRHRAQELQNAAVNLTASTMGTTATVLKPKLPPGLVAQTKKLPVVKPNKPPVKVAKAVAPRVVNADVSGVVMPKAKPVELKAEPMKLTDLLSGKTRMPMNRGDDLMLTPEEEQKILNGIDIDVQKQDDENLDALKKELMERP